MPKSVLDAIRMGLWDFEPPDIEDSEFRWTEAMPGTREKVEVLSERVRSGLPLWHPRDRFGLDEARSMIERR